MVTAIVRAGGFVVVPEQSPLLREARFLDVVLETRSGFRVRVKVRVRVRVRFRLGLGSRTRKVGW